ncbi:unnamed protein product [Allacma fusca]|uniref:Uncharacterized protein n=1 Tax=Allacma fusca TaxID=39272 RepID=A0A8J2PAE3_9HEXA|nr:unnamed protein product [Allacma fusca]
MDTSSVFQEKPVAYAGSTQSLRSQLNLFSLPETDVSVQFSSDYSPCYPLVSVKDAYNPVEIYGTNCDATDIVAPCSNFFHGFFSNLELYLNGTLITEFNNMYATTAYIQRLLSTTEIEKRNRLQNEFWFPNNKKGVFDVTDEGFKERYDRTKLSKEFTLLGHLSCNLFNQNRYLPPGSELRIVLRRSIPDICIDSKVDTLPAISGCPYKIQLVKAVFYASKKIVSQQIMDMHKYELSLGKKFTYPIVNVDLKTFSIAQGLTSASNENIVLGRIPKLLIIDEPVNVIVYCHYQGILEIGPQKDVTIDY